jgi:hypothetical protein
MLRDSLLLFLLLLPLSSTLTCYKCAVFNMTAMTVGEREKMSAAMTMLSRLLSYFLVDMMQR